MHLVLLFLFVIYLRSIFGKIYNYDSYRIMVHFLCHLAGVFASCSISVDQLVFELLEVALVLVGGGLKFLLLGPIVGQSMNGGNCVWTSLLVGAFSLMKLI